MMIHVAQRALHSRNARLYVAPLSLLITMALAFVAPFDARAQSGEDSGGSDISLFMGYMLPSQIDNVTEIMPVFGGRYGLALTGVGAVELEGLNTHSEGVDFTTFALSLRGELPLMHGLSAIVYGGADLHYYRPEGDSERHTDYGIHAGVGGLMLVTDTFWLRSDLKFLGNPGTQMQILFGLMFRTPSGQ